MICLPITKLLTITALLSLPVISHAQNWRVVERSSTNNVGVNKILDYTTYSYNANSKRGSNYNNDTINYDRAERILNNGVTVTETHSDRVYDNANMLVAHSDSVLDNNNVWVLNAIDSFTYANNRVSTHKVYKRTNISGQWHFVLDTRYGYGYDANGRMILKEESSFNGLNNPLRNNQKNYYTYNAQGLLVSDSATRFVGGNERPYALQEVDYDANGRKAQVREYNIQGGSKTLNTIHYFYYNANGQLARDSMVNAQNYAYNTHAYGYNGKGLLVADSIRSSSIISTPYTLYEYTSFDHVSKVEYVSKDQIPGSPNNVVGTTTFKYEEYFPVSINDATASNNVITLYPNPAISVLHINTSEAYTQGRIYNSMGQMVQTVNANSKQIDVTQLPAGNYYLQLNMKGKAVSKRFTVVR